MGSPNVDRPPHEVLLDSDRSDFIGRLDQGSVSPLIAIAAVIQKAGTDEDGNSNVPVLARIYDLLHTMPTNVNAERAKLVADTMKAERWEPRPSSAEWDPDQRADDRSRRRDQGGLPRR